MNSLHTYIFINLFLLYIQPCISLLDPCKAIASMGDIALTDHDYQVRLEQAVKFLKGVEETSSAVYGNNSLSLKEKLEYLNSLDKLKNSITSSNVDIKNELRRLRRKERKDKRRRRPGHRRVKRAATGKKDRLWEHAVIPYTIDANFSGQHKALFKQAMQHWENYTCVTFIERDPKYHSDYIVFTERPCGNAFVNIQLLALGFACLDAATTVARGVDCCSYVGKSGEGPQAVSIGKNCDKFGIVVHELGHVVGFWHEHTRPDRDKHIDIVTKNIMPGQEYNFNVMPEGEVNSLGEEYDYESIMHYARNTFSRGPYLDTIIPKKKQPNGTPVEIGQRVKLSTGDIRQANKLYQCTGCGRTLQEPSGEFSSPPAERKTQQCQWRISATHGEKIHLDVTSLNIPSSAGNVCRSDYLLVRDGHFTRSPIIGKFCGSQLPSTLISSGSRMWIEYKSSAGNLGGFKAEYEAVCGGLIQKEAGFISSPNYPDDYRPNKDCIWKIEVPERYTVAIEFQSFEIENHDSCVYDFLEFRDGHDENSPEIGKYCGYKIPQGIKSNNNKLWIRFKSDGSVQKAGFAAKFLKEYDECQTDTHGCQHKCVNTLGSYVCECHIGYELHSDGKKCEDACGGYLEASNGSIQSPSFPEPYPMNKKCIWQLVAPPSYRITLNFTYFDLEGNNQDCEYDSVEIKGDVGENPHNHGIFCGTTKPPLVTSNSNTLLVEFTSDNTVQRTGFSAHFFTDKDECANNNGGCQHLCKNTIGSYECSCHSGFTLHENKHDCKEGGCKFEISNPSGSIHSPNFPDSYPSRKSCVWHIAATEGHRIRLRFEEFELEPHQDCSYDNIEVFDGANRDSRTLGKYCGSRRPDILTSSANEMYIEFFSDASVQRRGFRATYSTVCGGRLTATSEKQKIYSHAKYGDQQYSTKEDCDWLIQAPPNKLVRLEFDSFEVETEADCGYDYIEIYDGDEQRSEKLGRFCGARTLSPFVSTGNELLLQFRSDDTVSWKGFLAKYYMVDPLSEESIAPPQTPTNRTEAKSKIKTRNRATPMVINTANALRLSANQDRPYRLTRAHRRLLRRMRKRHRHRQRRRRQ